MSANIKKAKQLLAEDGLTCCLVCGDSIMKSRERGVRPLLAWYGQGDKKYIGFCAADKVVGKAAAFLYILLGVTDIYAVVISEPARALLENNGIHTQYDRIVPAIRNRDNTGFCPMESAVWDINDAVQALEAIKNKLAELSGR